MLTCCNYPPPLPLQKAKAAAIEEHPPLPQPTPAPTAAAPPLPPMATVEPQQQQRHVVVLQQPPLTSTPTPQPPKQQQPLRQVIIENQHTPSQLQHQQSELFEPPKRRPVISPILPPVVDLTSSASTSSPGVDLLSPPPTPTARRITFDDHPSGSSIASESARCASLAPPFAIHNSLPVEVKTVTVG